MAWPIQKKKQTGFGLAVFILVLVGLLWYGSTGKSAHASYWVNHDRPSPTPSGPKTGPPTYIAAGDEPFSDPDPSSRLSVRLRGEDSGETVRSTVLPTPLLALSALLLISGAYLIHHLSSERKQVEQSRQQHEQVFRTVVSNAPIVLFAIDRAGTVKFSEGQILQGLGVKPGDQVGQSIFDLYRHLPAFLDGIRRGFAGELFSTFEGKDGSTFEVRYAQMKDHNDTVSGLVGVATDVTRRNRTEEALRESEERFRTLFEDAPVAYHEIDTQGIVRRVNWAERNLLGVEPAEMIGRHIWEFVAEEERDVSREAIRRKVSGQQTLVPFEREYVRRDGSRLILEIHENLIRDKNAMVVGVRSTMLDVTERKRAEQQLERRTNEITVLSQLGSLLQACMNTQEAHSVIAQFAPKLFATAPGAVCVLSASRNLVEAVAVWGDPASGKQIFGPDECWALRSGHIHYVDDAKSPLRCRHLSHSQASSYLCIPMMAQGEALGVLHIQSSSDPDRQPGAARDGLAASKQQLAVTLAEQIALALANLNLRESLRLQSIRDPLTSLFNRRYMEESLERELRRAARNKGPLGAIMLDLDHFKHYNDAFGHEAGDGLLRELGNFIQAHVRGEDIACRFGGEEFILILPEASAETTRQRAEELRDGVKHLNVHHRGQPLGTVTASLGVAIFPEHGGTADELLRAADKALYQAKDQGRDRVIILPRKK